MVLLTYFSLLLLLAFPLGQAVRIPLSLNVDITVLDIVVGVGSTAWLLVQIFTQKMRINYYAKAFIVFVGALFLSLVLQVFVLPHNQLIQGGLYLIRYICYGLLFFMVYANQKSLKRPLLRLLLLGGGLLVASGYIQFLLYPSLRNLIYAGWDEHFYRMFGTFLDPNYFGMFLVGYFILVLSLYLQQKQKKPKIFFASLAFVTFVAVILSYSRTALVALLVSLIVIFWKKVYTKKIISGACFLFVVAILVMSLVGRHAEGNDLLRLTSTSARLGDAKNALIIFSHNPIFGVGFNTYRFAQYKYGFMKGSPTQEDHGASGADTSILFVMATSGIIGIVAFGYLLYSHVIYSRKVENRLALTTLVAFFAGSFFVNILFYPSLLVWMWVVLGISESTSQ